MPAYCDACPENRKASRRFTPFCGRLLADCSVLAPSASARCSCSVDPATAQKRRAKCALPTVIESEADISDGGASGFGWSWTRWRSIEARSGLSDLAETVNSCRGGSFGGIDGSEVGRFLEYGERVGACARPRELTAASLGRLPFGHSRQSTLTKNRLAAKSISDSDCTIIEAGRDLFVLQGQCRLNQCGNACCLLEMADICLHRANCARKTHLFVRVRNARLSASTSSGSPTTVPVPWHST